VRSGDLLTKEMIDGLAAAGLDRIRISLQGLDADMYKDMSDVVIDFEQFRSNLRYFYEHRGNTKIYIKIMDVSLKERSEAEFLDLFADFAESGHILREGVFRTATIVGAEANGVVALHINNFRVVRIQLRNTVFKRPAGEGETEHGVYAEFVGDIEDVSTVGTEIPHGESVVLEVVVERSFESNVVGHEILTANIKAHAFNLCAVDQTYAEFFGALLGEGRSAQAGNSDKEEKLFHLRNVELRE